MLQEPPSEHLVAEHWDTEHTPTPCPALHPAASILQCPDPVVAAPRCHYHFSPHPDPFHMGLSLGFGLLWSGLILLVGFGLFSFVFFWGGKTGSENNKQVNSSNISDNERGENTPTPRQKQNAHMHGERRQSNSRLHVAKQQQPQWDRATSNRSAGNTHPKHGAMGTSHRVTSIGAPKEPAEPRNTELSHTEVGIKPLRSPSQTVELVWHCPCTDHVPWIVALLLGNEFYPLFIKDKNQ